MGSFGLTNGFGWDSITAPNMMNYGMGMGQGFLGQPGMGQFLLGQSQNNMAQLHGLSLQQVAQLAQTQNLAASGQTLGQSQSLIGQGQSPMGQPQTQTVPQAQNFFVNGTKVSENEDSQQKQP